MQLLTNKILIPNGFFSCDPFTIIVQRDTGVVFESGVAYT